MCFMHRAPLDLALRLRIPTDLQAVQEPCLKIFEKPPEALAKHTMDSQSSQPVCDELG